MIKEDVDLVSGFAIDRFTTTAQLSRRRNLSPGASKVAPWCENLETGGQDCPRHTQAVKELPQPQDFVEFGFTNTKPCCISVSW